ncbi:MAG: ABC transporter permease [Candidatus Saccharimonadales bacterium]
MHQAILRELKIKRNFIIIFCLIIICLVALYTSIYPTIHAHASQLMNSLGNVYKDIGIQGKPSFSSLEDYASIETFGFTWPILASIFAIGFAGSSLAGEIEKGTIGMLLSMPISRLRIYLAKYLTGLLSIIIFVMFSVFTALPVAEALKIHFYAINFVFVSIVCLLFIAALYSLGLMFSAMMYDKSRVYTLMGGIVIIMYVANTVAGLKSSLSGLKYISFFNYFGSQSALVNRHISLTSLTVLIAICIISTLIGSVVLIKRDISI